MNQWSKSMVGSLAHDYCTQLNQHDIVVVCHYSTYHQIRFADDTSNGCQRFESASLIIMGLSVRVNTTVPPLGASIFFFGCLFPPNLFEILQNTMNLPITYNSHHYHTSHLYSPSFTTRTVWQLQCLCWFEPI